MPYYTKDPTREQLAAMIASQLPRGGGGSGVPVSMDQLAQFSGQPEFATLQGNTRMSPASLATMLARTQAAQMKQERATDLGDFAATPLLNDSDESLVRSQYIRGGPLAASLLETEDGPRPEFRGGSINYAGIKPIKGPEELMANPKFQQLARQSPEKASQIYHAFTGKDWGADYKEQEKQRLAVSGDFDEGIRKGFIEGNFRRHPTMGWLERRRMVKDETGMQTVEKWEPVDSTLLGADTEYGARATGMARPENASILDDIPGDQRNAFMQEYYRNKESGKTDREALTAANALLPTLKTSRSQLATLQTPTAPTPHTAATPTAAYPEAAAADAVMRTGKQAAGYLWDNVPAMGVNAILGMGNVANAALDIPATAANFVGGLFGAKAPWFGKTPRYEWYKNTDEIGSDISEVSKGLQLLIDPYLPQPKNRVEYPVY